VESSCRQGRHCTEQMTWPGRPLSGSDACGCGRSPGRARPHVQPVDARTDRGARLQLGSGETRETASAPCHELPHLGHAHLHSANAAAHDAAASPPSRANPLSRIHNPVRHPPEPLMVRFPAAGPSTASSQPICNVPAPSLHPYLGRMRHSQCHDLLLWSLWVGRPRQEGMAVRRNVHRFIFAVAFDLPDLRDIDAGNDEGLQPGGAW
jgi:hypothetical protein